jgi:hypothetical protein
MRAEKRREEEAGGHQQARPKHDRHTGSRDLNPHCPEHGVHRLLAKLIADTSHRQNDTVSGR